MHFQDSRISVVIPSFRVRAHILGVLSRIGPEVAVIYVVDDCCPEQSGQWVASQCTDPRVRVLYHAENQGVGGAVMTGYRAAIEDGQDIVVKIDGDGQMDPALLPQFVRPAEPWPVAAQIMALGAVHAGSCALVYFGVGWGSQSVLRARPSAALVVSRVSGVLMLVIALLLLAEAALH